MASGQPFLDLLRWDPRDVDTLQEHYRNQAEEASLARQREAVRAGMG